jgi:hypothetical protein
MACVVEVDDRKTRFYETMKIIMHDFKKLNETMKKHVPDVNISRVEFIKLMLKEVHDFKANFVCTEEMNQHWNALVHGLEVILSHVNDQSGMFYDTFSAKSMEIIYSLIDACKCCARNAGVTYDTISCKNGCSKKAYCDIHKGLEKEPIVEINIAPGLNCVIGVSGK